MNQKQKSALKILFAFCVVFFVAGFGVGVAFSDRALTAEDIAKVEVRLDEKTGVMMFHVRSPGLSE